MANLIDDLKLIGRVRRYVSQELTLYEQISSDLQKAAPMDYQAIGNVHATILTLRDIGHFIDHVVKQETANAPENN